MAQNQYSSFGQGAKGFGKYYGGAYADQAIGNIMTEAVMPSVLHQDPRYFTKGQGGFWRRTGNAISRERELVTRNDDGRNQFNTSELLENGIAAGISNVYYPAADRTFRKTVDKWGQQIGLDIGFNHEGILARHTPQALRSMTSLTNSALTSLHRFQRVIRFDTSTTGHGTCISPHMHTTTHDICCA